MTRAFLAILVLLQLSPAAVPQDRSTFFRYRRSIQAAAPGQACVVLDASTLSHAEPFLKDLRIHDESTNREIPYALTVSEAQQVESEPATILNLGMRGNAISFDLAMPNRPYTEINLDLAATNFLATATVTGSSSADAKQGTSLGSFNLFDLTAQHLSRSTTLHLQESSFPFLHITLSLSPAGGRQLTVKPGIVRGAAVPPSREAQTLFTVAVQTSTIEQRGQQTIAHLHLPERVPIERVSLVLDPGFHANFSRDIVVSTHTPAAPSTTIDSFTGTVERVKLTEANRDLSLEQLSIPAILGANLQELADVDVIVNNGDDPPLPITAVQLDMRQRDLCFVARDGAQLTLFYGDSQLPAPVYEFARIFTPSASPIVASLGPEQPNPNFRDRPDTRAYPERHPHLIWIALLIVIGLLALVAFRSSGSMYSALALPNSARKKVLP